MPDNMNRVHNATNPHQGKHKRILCVCSAGLLRSPTTAVVLSQEPFNHNTRAAGIVADYALIPVDEVLLYWAQEIVCMTSDQETALNDAVKHLGFDKPVICLNIADNYSYRHPELMKLIKERYEEATKQGEPHAASNQVLPKDPKR